MTYDLLGQWDAGSKWSQDGCPNGMCLQSHVNMTEIYNAQVMITKAGMPANKVIVGVTSYGRAFKMKDPNCKGEMCEYTGTASVSNALPDQTASASGPTSLLSTGSFSSWIIGVFFHGSEDVHCRTLLVGNNCLDRQDTCLDKDDVDAPNGTGPAGMFIANLFRNSLLEKAAESAALGIVATGKDKNTGNVEDELSKAANLKIALNVIMAGWEKMVTGFAAKVFAGEPEGNGLLSDFMANGAFIPGGVPPGEESPRLMGVDEMKELAKHALFMYIIPEAWRHNKDANVAILDTGRACGDFSDYRPENIHSADAEKVELCFDNKQYLMLVR
ncbi:glycoside hydrolase family 18 protein [Parathielavia appendiculata]|uniref:Glycoside hydrolase family 18 protein n=1 Tax=Parathielavia appendiculata TaxID=2587402 RepID=A0AAN6UBH4_9PEZI|nr:glycoside hydrolase family 18 protein [Parathielavia appendiculata]